MATRGRRVVVADEEGQRDCFLSGQRAVVGDQVEWVEVQGEGGKVVAVGERRTVLVRTDLRGREQVLAANLGGIAVVTAPVEPPFRAGLLDRYQVAAGIGGLSCLVILNKIDQGVSDEVEAALRRRRAVGLELLRASAHTGAGLPDLAQRLAWGGPWALVGHSGVGKTSLAAALVPETEVGAIGALSEHWGTGQHTTSGSCTFTLPGGGELVDSPGIRTFAPGRLGAVDVRRHFLGVHDLSCRYRDCLHRGGEDGCTADARVDPELLASYRRLLDEVTGIEQRRRPRSRPR